MTYFTRLAFGVLGSVAAVGATGCRGQVAESAESADAAGATDVTDAADAMPPGDALACPDPDAGIYRKLPPCTSANDGMRCGAMEGYNVCVEGQWLGCGVLFGQGCSARPQAPEGSLCCSEDYYDYGTGACCVEGRFAFCIGNRVRYASSPACAPIDAGEEGRD
jgi:hypothetical protein